MGVKYGLSVDNVLEVDIVTADGKLQTVNACNQPDLFWAVRGGGGGTFGIVTRAVYKVYEKEPNYFRFIGTLMAKDSCSDCRERLMRAYVDWMDWTTENQPGLWFGYNFWGSHEDYTTISLYTGCFG